MKLLSEIGMQPQTQSCLRCEEAPMPHLQSWFHIPEGGVVCSTCYQEPRERTGIEFAAGERQILTSAPLYRFGQWPQNIPQPAQAKRLSHLLTQFASYHSQVQLP
jgi:recombinational DNA repair protein (RecF pathway)